MAAAPRTARDESRLGAPIALRHWPSHVRLWIVLALGLAADLWSKDWAFHTLRQSEHRVVIPHLLEFQTTLNAGALFGIGRGQTELFIVASALALVLVGWMFIQSPRRQWLTHIALGAILAGALGNMYDRVFVQLLSEPVMTPAGVEPRFYEVLVPEQPDATQTVERVIELYEYPRTDGVPARIVVLPPGMEVPRTVGYVRDFIKIPTRWFGQRQLWPWVFNVADSLLVCGVAVLALRILRERRAEHAERVACDGPV